MKNSPCNGCTERHPICHATCERYADWKKKNVPVVDLQEKAIGDFRRDGYTKYAREEHRKRRK